MASFLNEELMGTNLDIPDGEIKIEGKVNPVYADAINVHNKKKKEREEILKDKKDELKKPFLGTKGTTTVMPKTKEMKKLKLAEDMFRPVREHMNDAPEAYDNIFRVISNMEHIINYISDLTEEELTYADMKQSYDVLDDAMREFEDYLFEIKEGERRNGTLKEHTAVMDRKSWELQDKKNNKDMWSDIYNELVGMKGIEAPHRRLKTNDRYKASWGDNPDESEAIRVGAAWGGGIVVKAEEESALDFAKEVAETYGVEWKMKEHTSRYADAKFELFIYPDRQVVTESLVESVDSDIYSATAKYFDYGAPADFVEVLADLVDRALMNKEEGYDSEEAVHDAIDSGLIYHKDIWTVKAGYEDSQLEDETYERLFHDIYTVVESMSKDDIDEGLTSAQRYNRKMDKIFDDKKNRDADMIKFIKANSDTSDEEIKKAQDDDKVGLLLKNKGLHDKYWNKNESLKESYTEVDYICDGTTNFRVVGGGFNTSDALVSVEDEKGRRSRLSTGDVVEFYTWYDKKGNVIHEPSDEEVEESLNESRNSKTVILDSFDDKYVNNPEFLSAVTQIIGEYETFGGSVKQIKDFAITVTVDVGSDMTAGSYGCKFKALIDGDFDSDYVSEQWIDFDLSRYNNLVYQCWWEKESGEDEYYPTCDVITVYSTDVSSKIIDAYLQVDGEAIMYMLEPIETALYDYVPSPDDK